MDDQSSRPDNPDTPDNPEAPLIGVDAGRSPDVDVMPGSDSTRLAGKRADERDAELRDEEDIPPPSDDD